MIHHDIVPESREEAGAPVSEHDNKEGVASENSTTDEIFRWAESQGFTVRITNSDLKGSRLPPWELAGQLSESEDKDDEAAPTETV